MRFADASRSLLRDTVLRAVDGMLDEREWSSITMAEVAAASGVSRQTVYNEFGGRAELAQAYASWAGDQLLDEVERCVSEHRDDLAGALVAAFTVFLDLGAGHPLVRSLAGGASGELAAALVAGSRSVVVDAATARLVQIIVGTWPELTAEEVEVAAEVLVRLAISHLLQPTGTAGDAAGQAAQVLGPYIAQMVKARLAST